VMAMAGSLTIRSGPNGKGLTLAAALPGTESSRAHDLDVLE
jgi:hypothetical protein